MKIFFQRVAPFFVTLLLLLQTGMSFALDSAAILVVANKEMNGSLKIAQYYMKKRNIPESHLLSLSLSRDETMSRIEYDTILRPGVLRAIERVQPGHRIEAIVLIYGVPLKVAPPLPGEKEQARIRKLTEEQAAIVDTPDQTEAAKTVRKELQEEISTLLNTNQRAAVDSELALVKVENYNLAGWVKNPYFLLFQSFSLKIHKNQVLLVSRLDGPDTGTVYRIIDDTLATEAIGLKGTAYFDARWPRPPGHESLFGYRLYDASLHDATKAVAKRMEVVTEDSEELFPHGACPQAALYSGWYSLAQYIDSFDWQRGSIGYHMASSECSTLRKKESRVWCLKMLQKGIAATIGPVYEPYIQGFPLPAIFFSHLIEGYMSLGESYLVSLPYLSWQMVLIGDPLYQPFRR